MQPEIDAALEGRYEFDRVFLEEAMVVDEPYVSVDDTYYDPSMTVDILDRVSHVRRIVDE